MTTLKRRLARQERFPLRSVIPQSLAGEIHWGDVFRSDPGILWATPVPVRISRRPPIPMTRAQSRAYKRIQRVRRIEGQEQRLRELRGARRQKAHETELKAMLTDAFARHPMLPAPEGQ
ncbi:hypothetical protein [Kineosporia succinea]|uniref:Uncharacterized protein n=1 Tax=Kineosporia succinea TaxID=84632 RepID=A0ABT9P9V4_9ACTN|nr:hypothetical protein [Kineosporia succinea]MDP9829477.1 hypothetical protein [Kineosporia succinea]